MRCDWSTGAGRLLDGPVAWWPESQRISMVSPPCATTYLREVLPRARETYAVRRARVACRDHAIGLHIWPLLRWASGGLSGPTASSVGRLEPDGGCAI